jgi:hypothetical protein
MTITHGGRRSASRVRVGRQIAVVAAAVAAYFLARGATEAAYGDALRHAHTLVSLERGLGIYWEPALQDALAGSPWVRAVLNAIYIYGHWPVIVASLLFLARRHPAVYLRTRDTMLISGGIGLVVFMIYPVAPPRLAGLGMTDTVSVASQAYRVLQPTMFTNQYAALPSLHVGWDLVIGLALAAAMAAGGRARLRVMALAMPAAMVVAVVLTANHYLVDAVAGAALTGASWVAVGRFHRLRETRREDLRAVVTPLPIPAQRRAAATVAAPVVAPLAGQVVAPVATQAVAPVVAQAVAPVPERVAA